MEFSYLHIILASIAVVFAILEVIIHVHKGELKFQNRFPLIRVVAKKQALEKQVRKVPKTSIAVLPFLDMSPDKDQGYFCDGIAEELINSLTAVKDLRVVARTSAFSFRGKDVDVRDIGRTLNVGHVLEGSVRKTGAQLRITAQLVSIADGYHRWSEKYDRTLGDKSYPADIFAIQEGISMAIVDILKIKLLGKEKATLQKRYTENLEAYDLYLKGRYFWNKRTEKDLKKSIECYTKAIEMDSSYALAYAGLADSWIVLSDFCCLPSKEFYPQAKTQATKALELDNTLAEAYTSLGMIKSAYDWDWAGAERDFRRAIELKPGYATARHWYAFHLMHLARFQDSIIEYGKALEFDPLSLPVNLDFGRHFLYSHQHDQAVRQFQKVIEMDSAFPLVHGFLCFAYLEESMYEEALREIQRESELMTVAHPGIECGIGVVYARMGQRHKAEEILKKMVETSKTTYVSQTSVAWIHAALGNIDQAFECLEKAYDERDTLLRALKVSAFYDSLRSDARFTALLKKMGLEDK